METWKTIKLGLFKSAEEYMEAGCKVEIWAEHSFLGIEYCGKETEVDLVIVSGKELLGGGDELVWLKEIGKLGENMGLQICPAEVGPALRLAYGDQPFDEELVIVMDPFRLSGGNGSVVFSVAYKKLGKYSPPEKCLMHYPVNGFIHANDRYVFVKPRK